MKHCPWTDVPGGSTAARTARDRRIPDSYSQRRFGCAAFVYLASRPPDQRPRNDVIAATAPDPDTPILDCTNGSSIGGPPGVPGAAVAVANINALLSDRVRRQRRTVAVDRATSRPEREPHPLLRLSRGSSAGRCFTWIMQCDPPEPLNSSTQEGRATSDRPARLHRTNRMPSPWFQSDALPSAQTRLLASQLPTQWRASSRRYHAH